MSDWSAGYVSDIGYTYGYYTELNPLRLRLPFLNAGLVFPDVATACELGFGQGLSVGVHAAASAVQWYGTDFNPAQAAFAQELAVAGGSSARLFDQAFADFCGRSDCPEFDYIGLHGIWSWISDQNRAVIVDFLLRKLKVGGVLYVSYNTQPGWAAMLPMRELLTQHAEVLGASGQGIVSRIDAALDFADRLLATNPLFHRANPLVAERIKKMKEQNRNYLAHEYFNRDWHPMSFARMAEWLVGAKLDFACSAHYSDHVDAVNVTDEQQAFLREIPDRMLRETVRDFMCNTQFRRDYWVKGARPLGAFERIEALRAQRLVLVNPIEAIQFKVTGALGEATLNNDVYTPILGILADQKSHSLGELEDSLKSRGLAFNQILQAAIILAGKGDVALAQDQQIVTQLRRSTDRLNQHLMMKARSAGDIACLASPVTGGGLPVSRFHQLFLLAHASGRKSPAEWGMFAWQQLSALGQRLTAKGEPISSEDENIAELTRLATEFNDRHLPLLRALQIA